MTLISEPSDDYHANPAVSRSGLWRLYSKSPYHFRHHQVEETSAMKLGTAIHTAILEPERFETSFHRGPADRRGNKWRDELEFAENEGKECLTSGDYDNALLVREQAATCSVLQQALRGNRMIERSAYALVDGVMLKCRPDLYNSDMEVMVDLKSTTDASPEAFAKSVATHGYHFQEAFYTKVWIAAHGGFLGGFVFIAIEKPTADNPPVFQAYELDSAAVTEGYAIIDSALERYRECNASGVWPAYGGGVQTLELPRWAFKETLGS